MCVCVCVGVGAGAGAGAGGVIFLSQAIDSWNWTQDNNENENVPSSHLLIDEDQPMNTQLHKCYFDAGSPRREQRVSDIYHNTGQRKDQLSRKVAPAYTLQSCVRYPLFL